MPAEDLVSFHIYQQEKARAMYVLIRNAFPILHLNSSSGLTIRKQQLSKEAGKSMYANIVVEDLAGLGMSHMYTPGIDLFKKVVSMDQSNYPDTLKVLRTARMVSAI